MSSKRKVFLAVVLLVAFATVFAYLVSFPTVLLSFILGGMSYLSYPVSWGVGFFISIFVVMKSGLVERLMPSWGTKILTVAVSLFLFLVVLLLGTALLGGNVTYPILSTFYFMLAAYFPIKIMVVVLLLKILLSLKTTEDILQAEVVESKGSMLIMVLGFALFFQQLFPKLFGLSAMTAMQLSEDIGIGYVKVVLFVLGWIIPLLVAFIFVKKTKIYDRLTSSFAIKLLAVVIVLSVIFQSFYGLFFNISMLRSVDSKQFGLILISGVEVVRLLLNGILVACILKILLSLKPATHVEYHRNNS